MAVQTVTGAIAPDALGRTLMHEHLMAALPGWQTDTVNPGPSRRDMVARGVDVLAELKDAGFASMVDPIPADLGRDVEFMAEVSARAGFNVICATGLYHEEMGATSYWKARMMCSDDASDQLAEVMIRELTMGVGETGIRAGIIKVGTSHPPITEYERMVFAAAAKAAMATGAGITTHTDGVLGPEQVALLAGHGVPVSRIVVGHSCCADDQDYHGAIVDSGAWIGFDRFGFTPAMADERRVANLAALVQRGNAGQVVIAHDCVLCWRGRPIVGPFEAVLAAMTPLHFSRFIMPQLRDAGVSDGEIERMLVDNPRRYFEGASLTV